MSAAIFGIEQDTGVRISMSTSQRQNVAASRQFKAFRKTFARAYNIWYRSNSLPPELRTEVESRKVTADEFEKLTLNLQFQRYIALIDGRIRFDELPGRPHGAIIGTIDRAFVHQLMTPNEDNDILHLNSDDGTSVPTRNL
jgi:hypothetical protein